MTSQIGHLSHGVQHADPERTWAEYRAVIEAAIAGHARSQQTRIGPSEVGTPCDRCLAHKLGGTRERRDPGGQWLPTVGTAVHEWLKWAFIDAQADLTALRATRYLVEQEVSVGFIGGINITGNADLFDLWAGEVTDWKIMGDNRLKALKASGPDPVYRIQAHLYGRGYARRGCTVNRVRIAGLPRNAPTLAGSVIWSEPYDEAIALAALDRADRIAKDINLRGLSTVLDGLPPHIGDHSCRRMPDAPTGRAGLDGLISEPTTNAVA